MAGLLRSVWGVVVVLAPGVAVAWAFAPRMDWAKRVVLSVVFALSVVPGILFALNLVRGTPLSLKNASIVAVSVTVGAVLWRLAASRSSRKV